MGQVKRRKILIWLPNKSKNGEINILGELSCRGVDLVETASDIGFYHIFGTVGRVVKKVC